MRAALDARSGAAARKKSRLKSATRRKKSILEKYGPPLEDENMKSIRLMKRIKESSKLQNLGSTTETRPDPVSDWKDFPHIDGAQAVIVNIARLRVAQRQRIADEEAALKQAKIDKRNKALEGGPPIFRTRAKLWN